MEPPPLLVILEGTFFDYETLGALVLLTVLITSIGSLLISGPFPDWFSTRLPPSSTSTPPPSPASSPSSLSAAIASSGFSLAVLNLASPTLASPAMPSADPSSIGRRNPDVVPHRCLLGS